MAISSLTATMSPPLPSPKRYLISAKPKSPIVSFPSSNFIPKPYRFSASRIFVAPEVLESEQNLDFSSPEVEGLESSATSQLSIGDEADKVEGLEFSATSRLSIGDEADKMAPKQKIRIKLRSYWVPLIEDSCKQIMDAARTTNAKTMGPVPLPTKRRVYCVLKSPHVHKDARFHFEIRTHQRLIDILYPTAQTIDSLMQLDLPAGVDVEVKL